MTHFQSFLFRSAIVVSAGAAVTVATVWLCQPGQDHTSHPAHTMAAPTDVIASTTSTTPLSTEDDPQAAWLAYQKKAQAIRDKILTPVDKQYFETLQVAVCQDIFAAREQQAASKPVALPEDIQAELADEDKMCATVKKTDSNTVRAMMQQAADAGQKDAQLYLLRADAKAAGMMLISTVDPTTPQPPLTAEERAKRESLISSLQALAYTGHRDALATLAEVKMRTATDKNGYATSFAMSLISYLDWSKPLPASAADEIMEYVPQELRSEVLLRMQDLYRECCATAPNKDRYAAALDALGPPPPQPTLQASVAPSAGKLSDIFRVQQN